MTLRHIKIFLAVCQHDCNTTKAAKALLMTQPAVSLAIRELEEYYGVRLFDRIGRRLNITEAGQQFLSYGSHIVALFDDMEKGLRNWDALGLLRVGASITIGAQLLPNYIRAFYAQYPGKEIQAVVDPPSGWSRRSWITTWTWRCWSVRSILRSWCRWIIWMIGW